MKMNNGQCKCTFLMITQYEHSKYPLQMSILYEHFRKTIAMIKIGKRRLHGGYLRLLPVHAVK